MQIFVRVALAILVTTGCAKNQQILRADEVDVMNDRAFTKSRSPAENKRFARSTFDPREVRSTADVVSGGRVEKERIDVAEHNEVQGGGTTETEQTTGNSTPDGTDRLNAITITSEPPHAKVYVSSSEAGEFRLLAVEEISLLTPTTIILPDGKEMWVRVEEQGYQDPKPIRVDQRSPQAESVHFRLVKLDASP